jgi:hypothetical protein
MPSRRNTFKTLAMAAAAVATVWACSPIESADDPERTPRPAPPTSSSVFR